MNRPITLFVIVMLLVIPARTPAQVLELKVNAFDEDRGLNSRIIRCMMQDSLGYFWAGTADGLSRFDGYSFKTFRHDPNDPNSIAGNFVTAINQDRNNCIWAGFYRGGISCYNPRNGKFTNFSIPENEEDALSQKQVTSIFIDEDNEVWGGVQGRGLFHLNRSTGDMQFYDVVPPTNEFHSADQRLSYNQVYHILPDDKQGFWLATHDGLYHFDKKTKRMQARREKPLQKGAFRNDLFGFILPDGDSLWLSSWAGGISCYNTRTNRWHNFKVDTTKVNVSTTNIISGLSPKGQDMLWVTSHDKGFGMFDKKSKRFFFFGGDSDHPSSSVPSDLCYGLLQDREGGIWISCEKGLLRVQMQARKFPFRTIPVTRTDNKEHYEIGQVYEDDDFILTGIILGDGLQVENKKTGAKKTLAVDIIPGEENFLLINDILKDKEGTIWVLSRDYIYRFDPMAMKLVKASQPPLAPGGRSSLFNRFATDDDGNLWIVSRRNGVFRYNIADDEFTSFNQRNTGVNSITSNFISRLVVDGRGRVWIGGPFGCLAYFDKVKGRFVPMGVVQSAYGVPSNNVRELAADSKGKIWAGTDAGLCKLDATKDKPELERVYTAADGLRGDLAGAVCEDDYGHIWCITPSALCVIDPTTNNITSFGIADGLKYSTVGERLIRTPNKKMLIAAWQGYHIFDPATLQAKHSFLPVHLTSFTVNGKERYYLEQFEKSGSIDLSASDNSLTFEFAAIGFNSATRQQYAYMLEGVDDDWIYAGNRRYANYSNLAGGSYVFRVKASPVTGNWSGPELQIPVHVATRFYKTWWFRVAAALLIVAILYWISKSRIRHREKVHTLQTKAHSLEKEKAQVMYENLKQQLNPHFLFNSLTSLGSLIRVNPAMAGEFLDSLSKTYRYILKSRDNETVPLSNELKFAENYVKLQQTRFEKGLTVVFNVDEAYHHFKIAPVTLQNLVENAIKHNIIDEESPLVINIYAADGYIIVQNNLQKKNFVETSNRQGLINLQSLYRYLSDRPVQITEDSNYFTVKIPLL